jgi:hypothetical protein
VASAYPRSKSAAKPKSPSSTTESLHAELDRLIGAVREKPSLSAMVLTVLSGLRLLGQQLVTLVLEQRSQDLHRGRLKAPHCPHCGRRMRKPQMKETLRMTLLGKLRYRRHRWLCPRCKRTHAIALHGQRQRSPPLVARSVARDRARIAPPPSLPRRASHGVVSRPAQE